MTTDLPLHKGTHPVIQRVRGMRHCSVISNLSFFHTSLPSSFPFYKNLGRNSLRKTRHCGMNGVSRNHHTNILQKVTSLWHRWREQELSHLYDAETESSNST
jgi:hypothetical protein